ncbi:enoyl-CoA hydratase/isomerase family protein [Candidatus Poriferisodalis sp.]|uniref:enoyl-CoA hydratase/isomerase family protein n=1 Tax=Candidatus Poriferisodalis sp. TaxID=3101277 RepID=UPI003B01D935
MIRLEHDGAVGIVTLSHPPHNLIGDEFIDRYCTAQEDAVAAGARAILVRSDLRHFCAGADVKALGPGDDGAASDPAAVLDRLESIPVPTVAAIHGAVLGGGFELALACDMIVAAESAQVGAVEVTLGLVPLLGAIQRLVARAGPARAREITMLGRRYRPAELERLGVVNLVVPDAELEEASMSLARQLAAGPTVALGVIKRVVNIAVNDGTKAADEALSGELATMWASNDVRRGTEAMFTDGPGTAVFEGN